MPPVVRNATAPPRSPLIPVHAGTQSITHSALFAHSANKESLSVSDRRAFHKLGPRVRAMSGGGARCSWRDCIDRRLRTSGTGVAELPDSLPGALRPPRHSTAHLHAR